MQSTFMGQILRKYYNLDYWWVDSNRPLLIGMFGDPKFEKFYETQQDFNLLAGDNIYIKDLDMRTKITSVIFCIENGAYIYECDHIIRIEQDENSLNDCEKRLLEWDEKEKIRQESIALLEKTVTKKKWYEF
jgi:hypothetical protein